MQRIKKIILIVSGIVLIIMFAVILFISPLTKYLVEKYDVKYTGRQIKMDWAYVNPWTGYVHFSNLKIYEFHSDSVFLSIKGVSANIHLTKLWGKTYEIEKLTLDQPWGTIIQAKKAFNFDDILEKFTPKKDSTVKPPLHLNILNISIINGEFHYLEKVTPINYFIKNVNIESTGMRWNVDTIAIKLSLKPGIGKGDVSGNFSYNLKTLQYTYAAVVRKFDLGIIQQYMNDLANYGSFRANLDANWKATGNFKNPLDMTGKGTLAINNFHLGKNASEDFVSFDRFLLVIKEMSPLKKVYFYDSVILTHPYFKYERYDYLDNLQNMFGKNGQYYTAVKADPTRFNLIIEIVNYIKQLSTNFFKSDYKINTLAVTNGDLKYNDFAISEKFSMDLNPLYVAADSIDKHHKWIHVYLKSGIKPYGNVSIGININPKDSSDFDLSYNFQKLAAAQFNPYTATYTSFLMDRGTIELNGNWYVRNGKINSNNHMVMMDPRIGKRLKNKNTTWIPLPLIMAFVREKGNVIDYEIPITGNLNDPKFHWKDMIMDLLNNLIVKPISIPYRINVKNTETIIEKSLSLKWEMRSNDLRYNQKQFLKKMADFLKNNPSASIVITPQHYTTKEKEYVLFFEAKKKYYLTTKNKTESSFTKWDSSLVVKMSVKDENFVNFIDKQINGKRFFTIQEKCAAYTNPAIINAKLSALNRKRAIEFMEVFKEKLVDKRITFNYAQDVIPYNGFSFYKIDYTGTYPENLIAAYLEMEGWNQLPPRKAFRKKRSKTGVLGR